MKLLRGVFFLIMILGISKSVAVASIFSDCPYCGDIQFFNEEDAKFISSFEDRFSETEYSIVGPRASTEELIKRAESAERFLEENAGFRFANGRLLEKESTLLMDVYSHYLRAYDRAGDCEKARLYAEKFKKMVESDIQTISLYEGVFISSFDGDTGNIYKKSVAPMIASLYKQELTCVQESDVYSLEDVDINAAGEPTGKNYYEQYENDMKKISSGFVLSKKDIGFYADYLNASSIAYNLVKTDPSGAIKAAEKILSYLERKEGRRFQEGSVLKMESTLLLDTEITLTNANDAMGRCEEAKSHFERFKQVLGSDYQVIDYFYYRTYDPGEAQYEEMKNRDLQILSQYPVVEKCISPKDFDAASGNENK